jgi:hypothetical protein
LVPDKKLLPRAALPAIPRSFVLRHPCGAALLIATVLLALHSAVELLFRPRIGDKWTMAVEAVALGLLSFLLLLHILHKHRKGRAGILQRLETIDELNRQIRDALQVITFNARSFPTNKAQLADIRLAVSRIDWTLREILPKMEPEARVLNGALGSRHIRRAGERPLEMPCAERVPE